MQTRKLGNSDLHVSIVGLGANNFGGRMDLAATRRVVDRALDLGITLIDTADSYGGNGASEHCLGQILGARRKDVVLATKFGMAVDRSGKLAGASRGYIMQAVEASLKRLATDWIDLYQLHRPDPATPIEETLRALDDLVRQGKVRFVGCSNMSAAAGHRGARNRAAHRRHRVRELPGRIQPAGARHRARAHSGDGAARARAAAVLSAGERAAHRQVPRGRPDARGRAAQLQPAPLGPVHHRAKLADRRRARGIRDAARPRPRSSWRSPGSWRSRSCRASSPARARPSRSSRMCAPVGWSPVGRGVGRGRPDHGRIDIQTRGQNRATPHATRTPNRPNGLAVRGATIP